MHLNSSAFLPDTERLPARRDFLIALGAGALAGTAARAQDYPSKTIRIVSPFSPGATSDLIARALAKSISTTWGVGAIVENKPGGGSSVGADLVAKSAPDGHTLLSAAAAIGVIPALLPKLPYVPYKDLVPITVIGTVPFMMLVHPSVPVKTVPEFVAYAKANPGKINFSSGGNGTIPHMGGELLKLRAGLDMVHIPFKGGADSITALLGGQVQMTIDGGPHVIGHIKSGALRMLGVATLQRLPEFPTTPTIAESGFPGFESNAWQSLWVTGGTPAPVVKKIAEDVRRILRTPEVSEQLRGMGVALLANSPEEAEQFIRAETTKWAAVIKASGARAD
jgi:tripartite-type tricarboxylate transporter receptor subunit TctC